MVDETLGLDNFPEGTRSSWEDCIRLADNFLGSDPICLRAKVWRSHSDWPLFGV